MSQYVITRDMVVALVPTDRGWKSRSNVPNRMNHDYVSDETLHEVLDWMRMDHIGPFQTTEDRDVVLDVLEDHVTRPGAHLWGNVSLAPPENAARVLDHLECGW